MRGEFRRLKVLIVDDCEVERDYLALLCRDLGVVGVTVAENGLEAVKCLKRDSFDVVFIDLEMPVMNGVELVREIADEKLADSVVILSSKDPSLILSVGTMADAGGVSVLGTFQKPVQIEQINNSFVRALTQSGSSSDLCAGYETLGLQDLLSAIEKEELYLKYQPKLSAETLDLVGVEALARWDHPDLGSVPPFYFVSVAERFGVIGSLTDYLYAKALADRASWLEQAKNIHLAFNLSPLSLSEKRLADKVENVSLVNHAAPEDIVLEVTENAVAGEVSRAIETLAKLRLKGFGIAIDDYGTGYANAQQIARVPATELKLDRSLIDGVATRPQQQAIVKSTVLMAKELKLKTVAEGIEHEQDFRFLQSLKVDMVQGFLFARPMSGRGLLSWLDEEQGKLRATYC